MTMMTNLKLLILLGVALSDTVQAFTATPHHSARSVFGGPKTVVYVGREEEEFSIPQLPPPGASSFDSTSVKSDSETPALVDRKFDLLYTCKQCETRNTHKVSRIAYYEGVVIATCKGCQTQHLIADNLGWTNIWDGVSNIEQDKDSRGEVDINRVTTEVFQLEKILSNTGIMVDENGSKVME